MKSAPRKPNLDVPVAAEADEDDVDVGCVRLGDEDGVVQLNVGGKTFETLRSTVETNAVLTAYLKRAEANPSLCKNGAVFIDRDPEHFGVLLNHLRNKTEGLVSCLPSLLLLLLLLLWHWRRWFER